MLPIETLGSVVVAAILGPRTVALCVVGIVAVIRAERRDIPAVMRALTRTGANDDSGNLRLPLR